MILNDKHPYHQKFSYESLEQNSCSSQHDIFFWRLNNYYDTSTEKLLA